MTDATLQEGRAASIFRGQKSDNPPETKVQEPAGLRGCLLAAECDLDAHKQTVAKGSTRWKLITPVQPLAKTVPVVGCAASEVVASPRPLPLVTGTGGAGGAIPMPPRSLVKEPERLCWFVETGATAARMERWSKRHHLVFKNEEVSRLDRAYFDRPREHEAIVGNGPKETLSVSTWSLLPMESKEAVSEAEAPSAPSIARPRAASAASWNTRHYVMFDNRIHQNARSYFGRWREPMDPYCPAGPPEASYSPSITAKGYFAIPTVAAECRLRSKVQEDGPKVNWKIQEKTQKGFSLQASLRRCESGPGDSIKKSKTLAKLSKRRSEWFSSHDVVF